MAPALHSLFAVDTPALEIALRGAALYLLLFVLFRYVLRGEVLAFGFAEALVLVLIADATQNAMTGENVSLAESAILAAGMLACHLLIRCARLARGQLSRRLHGRRKLRHHEELSP